MGFDTLWSYDEDADFPGDAPKPRSDDLLGLFEGIFSALSPETDVFYRELCRWRFFDLDNRPGKIRGAYSNHLPLYRLPFTFETFDGTPIAQNLRARGRSRPAQLPQARRTVRG